jgi:hypothetical protein
MKKNIIVFLFCLLIPFSVYAGRDSLVVNLRFDPNHGVGVRPKIVPADKIFFENFKDVRSNPRSIGVNLEHRNRLPVFSSSDGAVNRFVHAALIREFRRKNFSLEEQAGTASKVITGTILKFWTQETSIYSSQTQVQIEVKDKSGRLFYTNTYTGFGRNRGRSFTEYNYNECISDSINSLVGKIFSDQGFLSALSATSPQPAAKK